MFFESLLVITWLLLFVACFYGWYFGSSSFPHLKGAGLLPLRSGSFGLVSGGVKVLRTPNLTATIELRLNHPPRVQWLSLIWSQGLFVADDWLIWMLQYFCMTCLWHKFHKCKFIRNQNPPSTKGPFGFQKSPPTCAPNIELSKKFIQKVDYYSR